MAIKTNSNKSKFKPVEFLKEAQEELKKVSKPNREETLRATFMAIALMLFFAIVLALLDVIFHRIMAVIL